MAYLDDEASKHGGKPVELFRYQGTYANFYYTSGPKAVEFQGPDEVAPNLYVPIAMRRSAVNTATQNDDNAEVTIDMPVSTDIIAIYGFSIAPPDLVLTIFRGHNPGQFIRFWSGNVENISVVKGTATIRVPSLLASALTADFPNVYFQTPCNHDLYDARCGVDYALWSHETAVAAIDGRELTLDSIGTLDGQLVGGDALLASGERRMIIAQAADVITVNYPFAGAEVDSVITIAAGCDLAYQGDCKNRFNNTKRNGGFPYIPPKNIFQSGLEPGKDVADEACLPIIFDGWAWEWVFVTEGLVGPVPGIGTVLSVFDTPEGWEYVDGINVGAPGGTANVFSYVEEVVGLEYRKILRVIAPPGAGTYSIVMDPNNLYPASKYSCFGRPYNSVGGIEYWTNGAFVGGGGSQGGTFDL